MSEPIITIKEARKLLGKELNYHYTDNQIRALIYALTSVSSLSLKAYRVPKISEV